MKSKVVQVGERKAKRCGVKGAHRMAVKEFYRMLKDGGGEVTEEKGRDYVLNDDRGGRIERGILNRYLTRGRKKLEIRSMAA